MLDPSGACTPKSGKKNNQIPIPKINCFARYQLRERKTEELNGWLTRRLLLSRRSERWENKREDCTGCLKKVVNRILRALLQPLLEVTYTGLWMTPKRNVLFWTFLTPCTPFNCNLCFKSIEAETETSSYSCPGGPQACSRGRQWKGKSSSWSAFHCRLRNKKQCCTQIVNDLPWKHESGCDFLHGFRAKMASGSDNGNLVQDFEEAFQVLFKYTSSWNLLNI